MNQKLHPTIKDVMVKKTIYSKSSYSISCDLKYGPSLHCLNCTYTINVFPWRKQWMIDHPNTTTNMSYIWKPINQYCNTFLGCTIIILNTKIQRNYMFKTLKVKKNSWSSRMNFWEFQINVFIVCKILCFLCFYSSIPNIQMTYQLIIYLCFA